MAVTISEIISHMDRFIGDSSTDRISTADRYEYITQAVAWLQEELGNDHQISTYTLNHIDTVYRYKISAALADLLVGADLKTALPDNKYPFTHKSSRELNIEIAQGEQDNSWTIEREDDSAYLLVNYPYTAHKATVIEEFDSITNWEADTTNTDATNVTLDDNEVLHGTNSLNFDVDVSQSANNKAGVFSDDYDLDLSSFEDLGTFLLDVYIPDVTEVSSYTLYWGDDSSNYWTRTVTTDIDGSALADGKQTLAFEWAQATVVGSPVASDVNYIKVEVNYTASQADDTDFRIDYLRVARDTDLTFSYLSWYVGTNNSGTSLVEFSATTDIPYFSGKYDQYKYAVAHKAAALAMYSLRLIDEARENDLQAERAMRRKKKLFPKLQNPEQKSFKVYGINFSRRR